MPFKDEDQLREYQRDWARRKRAGQVTRTKTPMTDEERKERKRQTSREFSMRKSQERKEAILEFIGRICFFCGVDNIERRLSSHRKDGTKHTDFYNMNKEMFNVQVRNNEYVRVCYKCHKHVHWCMDKLNMTWDDILERLSL